MKKIILAGVFLLFSGYLIASPYISAYQLQQAIDQADGNKVVSMMDVDSVKYHLVTDLHKIAESGLAKGGASMSGFGTDIAKQYLNSMINSAMTPDNISTIIEMQAQNQGAKDEEHSTSLGYVSPNRFEIRVMKEDGIPIRLELHRHMLTWKIKHIHIPKSYLTKMV